MLTRRVHNRTFLLRPSPTTNRIIGYVLAVMQHRWNIRLHAVCVLSNHWHIVLTDPDGNIVDFQRDCHSSIARALNVQYDDTDSVWNGQQTSRVQCEQPEDTINKIAYTMANPVETPLVCHGHSWPGLRRAWPSKPRIYKRPKQFFRGEKEGGEWPETAVLELSRPPGFDDLSDEELAGVIRSAIDAREKQFRDQHRANDQQFIGRAAILRQSRYARARSEEPRSRVSPKVACADKSRRIERLTSLKLWLRAYRFAMSLWRAGDRDVIFPAGTYKMRVLHGVACAEADS